MLIYGNVYLRDDMLSLVPRYTNLTRLMHVLMKYQRHCQYLKREESSLDSPDQNHDLLNLVPALCCVWKEHDWSYIIQHGLYGKLKEAAKRGLVRADGLVVRLLRVCMVLAAASATEECAVLPSMIAMELETLPRVVRPTWSSGTATTQL